MRLSTLEVDRFRCFLHGSIDFQALTMLVGANGAGKSTIFRAIRAFYEGATDITPDDFYNRDTTKPISITLGFSNMSPKESTTFAAYVHEGRLRVTLKISTENEKYPYKYVSYLPQHAPFVAVRAIEGSAAEKFDAFRKLIASDTSKYNLTGLTSWARADAAMTEWESANPGECSLSEDAGTFFSAPNKGGPLGEFTQLIFVPALRDAMQEATESRTNTLGRLMMLIGGNFVGTQRYLDLKREFSETLQRAVTEESTERLPNLQQKLTEALGQFAPGSSISLNWSGHDVAITAPKAGIQIDEGGFVGDLDGKGHGLQRLFVVALLQVAAETRDSLPRDSSGTEATSSQRHSLLVIEEPELYQHPTQARRFAQVLRNLAIDSNQVAYSTHSPLFVSIDRFDDIRLVSRIKIADGEPLAGHTRKGSIQNAMNSLSQAAGFEKYDEPRFRATLASIMDDAINEGFFADKVVLVEGKEDKAVIETALRLMSFDIEASGLAVIPADGKQNLDRPFVVFSDIGLPVYLIFDGDEDETTRKEQRAELNRKLQVLAGVEDPVNFPKTTIGKQCAVFRTNLVDDIQAEFGEGVFVATRDDIAREMGWTTDFKKAAKNPKVLNEILRKLRENGKESKTLRSLCESIIAFAR